MIVPAELDTLVYWMQERDRIRAAKEAGDPKPWTEDPLLRDFRWCNVRRMDDRVSIFMLDRWYQPDGDSLTALAAAVLGRLVNWPDSLMVITGGKPFERTHLEGASDRLAERAAQGAKIFTGAYVVPGVPGESKIYSVCSLAEAIASEAFRIHSDSMQFTWANLVRWDGIGSFLAGQMVADLVHVRAGRDWWDVNTWAPVGPGSARGMNRLHGRSKDAPVKQGQFLTELAGLIDVLKDRVPDLWSDRRLQAMDVQNCLCEFDKYRRLQLGEGKVRARYDGGTPGQRSMFA